MSENTIFFIVSFISLIVIFFINYLSIFKPFRLAFNSIFFCESVLLSFFFAKYPLLFSLPLTITSFYYLTLSSIEFNRSLRAKESSIVSSNFLIYFKYIGLTLVGAILVYEYFGDRIFNHNGLLVLALAIIFILYDKVPDSFHREKDYMLIFFTLLVFFFIIPMVSYKILNGFVGTKTEGSGFVDNEPIVHFFLVKPLSIILTLMGYDHYANGEFIHINNYNDNSILIVSIAESCSGIYSIIVFISALISYLIIEYRSLKPQTSFLILILGIIISYFSNLFRMTIIILSGHYKGIDFLLFVHQHIGWLIFTLWIMIFWFSLDSLVNYLKRNQVN